LWGGRKDGPNDHKSRNPRETIKTSARRRDLLKGQESRRVEKKTVSHQRSPPSPLAASGRGGDSKRVGLFVQRGFEREKR